MADKSISLAVTAAGYQTKTSLITVPGGTWTRLCGADSRRWNLWVQFVSGGGGDTVYSPQILLPWMLLPNNQSATREWKYRDTPAQTTGEIFTISGAGGTIMVIEELFVR